MSCDFIEQAVAPVRALQPYQPGKPIEELAREQGLALESVVKLASNENPLGPSSAAVAAIGRAASELCRYPDANGFALKQALAERLGVQQAQLTLGNGSNDLLVLLAESFLGPGRSAVFSEYAFVVYPLAVQASGAEAIVVPARDWGHDLAAMAGAIREDTRLVFLANPNNPTGSHFSIGQLKDFLDQVPARVLVVLDEAYVEYGPDPDGHQSLALTRQYSNLVITRTFSKAYGLAACRIGYAISHPQVANILNRLRPPFNVNALAQAAALAVLADPDYLTRSRQVNGAGLKQLAAGLQALGLQWIPSLANFICVDLGQDAEPVYRALLSHGVIVRPLAGYAMPRHLRISVGLAEENRRCLDALEASL